MLEKKISNVAFCEMLKNPESYFDKPIIIGAPEYGGKTQITVVEIFRNESRRDFAWHKYRFDIVRIEKTSPVAVSYAGLLESRANNFPEFQCHIRRHFPCDYYSHR